MLAGFERVIFKYNFTATFVKKKINKLYEKLILTLQQVYIDIAFEDKSSRIVYQ